jgi:hypothetical protein
MTWFWASGADPLCLSPVKLCHNLIDTEDQHYGPQTSLRREYFEAIA